MRLRFLRVGLQCIVRLLQQRTAGWLPLLRRKQGLYAHGYATATDPNKARPAITPGLDEARGSPKHDLAL